MNGLRISQERGPIASALLEKPEPQCREYAEIIEDLRAVAERAVRPGSRLSRECEIQLSKEGDCYAVIERKGRELPIYGSRDTLYFRRNGLSFRAEIRDIVELQTVFIYRCSAPKTISQSEIPPHFIVTSKGA
jgi:hypothetical protein